MVAAGSLDHTVWEWDPASGRRLRILRQPTNVGVGSFSPDGGRIVTADFDGTLRVWDTCPGCRNAGTLLALGRRQVTRGLSAQERATFLGGD